MSGSKVKSHYLSEKPYSKRKQTFHVIVLKQANKSQTNTRKRGFNTNLVHLTQSGNIVGVLKLINNTNAHQVNKRLLGDGVKTRLHAVLFLGHPLCHKLEVPRAEFFF